MSGKLFGVGVGTGDPEELTLKGLRVIQESDIILVPISGKGRKSRAFTAIESYVENQEIVELLFPMTTDDAVLKEAWNNSIEVIDGYLKQGKKVTFITIGDISIYCTFTYIADGIRARGHEIELVAGIPSFCAIAAKAQRSLCDWEEPLLIYPSNYNTEKISAYLEEFDNIVLMKAAKEYDQLLDLLESKNRLDKSFMISKCGFEDEEIVMNLKDKDPKEVNYLSTIIVKKGDEVE